MKKILMVAYHFPPFKGGSGVERTLKFSYYLSQNGWLPIVLSIDPKAYPQDRREKLSKIPINILVKRTFALDASRHLSMFSHYFRWLALPDRWVSWWFTAIPVGLYLIRKHRPHVLWSTYPVATAHLIGLTLHFLTGIPWIADFRDPVPFEEYPSGSLVRQIHKWIEKLVVKKCSCAVFTTAGTLRMYTERYPNILPSKGKIIANGYDERDFSRLEQNIVKKSSLKDRIVVVHSGVLYPFERDPSLFFAALLDLYKNRKISSSDLRVILRASSNETEYRKRILELGLDDIIFLEPAVSHQEALKEIISADGLLLFQGSRFNHQIPAKIYEYMRAKRPIFAMTDPKGDTAELLRKLGIDTVVSLYSEEEIRKGFLDFLDRIRNANAPIVSEDEIKKYTREARAKEFIELLKEIVENKKGRQVLTKKLALKKSRIDYSRYEKIETSLLVTIDAEENWDWPGSNKIPNVSNIYEIPSLQKDYFDKFNIKPVYLITHPVATDPRSISILTEIQKNGKCEIGTHLHNWNSPPFTQQDIIEKSYHFKLPYSAEKQKIEDLSRIIQENFKTQPIIFRAGRWGADGETIKILSELGYKVDTSVSPLMDYTFVGGPNFYDAPLDAYFPSFDDILIPSQNNKVLLELPVTCGFSYLNFEKIRGLYKTLEKKSIKNLHLIGIFGRLNILKKIKLSPESANFFEMKKLVDLCLMREHKIIHLTFHSSTNSVGDSPFARNEKERNLRLQNLYMILDYIRNIKKIKSYAVLEIYKNCERSSECTL